MAIPQLDTEQIRTWTLEQKDRWWLENVYRGDMLQLTFRSACMGFILGGVLSATNLYIGAKTGWSLGVGITSVILAFAFFRLLHSMGWCSEFTILENNCSQSIATAAGYMTSPLTSSMAAYMIEANRLLPWHQLILWNVLVSILGVLFAFPMKRRFINDEQHPFPEGRAAAVVLDTLHQSDSKSGAASSITMLTATGLAGLLKFFQADTIQRWIQVGRLKFDEVQILIPDRLDKIVDWMGKRIGLAFDWGNFHLRGIKLDQLTIIPSLEIALIGAGGLMGMRTAFSLMVGAILNYCVLAPWMISLGEIAPLDPFASELTFGLSRITLWSLWPGVACMVAASFVAFFSKPQVLWTAVQGLFTRRKGGDDPLRDIEFPPWISVIGIPIVSLISAWLAEQYFGVNIWLCLLGLPLTFILTLVAANSTALTSITPIGATSKITQLFYGVAAPGQTLTNLATASLTAEAVSNASNLLMDIKPGYMLGAKPRQQALGHIIGIFAGSICSVPLFFLLFTQGVKEENGKTVGIETIQSADFEMPSVTVWRAVAKVLTQGVETLRPTVRYAVVVAVAVGTVLELTRILTRGKFILSPVGLGLAFVINFGSSFAMFLGALTFWCLGSTQSAPEGTKANFWKTHHETICAGIITGAALMGILDALVGVLTKTPSG